MTQLPGQLTIDDALAELDDEERTTMTELSPDADAALTLLELVEREHARHSQRLKHPHDVRAALSTARHYASQLPPPDALSSTLVLAYLTHRTAREQATLAEALDEAHALIAVLATLPTAITAIRSQTIADELTAALRDEKRS